MSSVLTLRKFSLFVHFIYFYFQQLSTMKLFSSLLSSVKPKPPPQAKQIQSTVASRLINPELYIKPNKHVMNFGVAALAGCVMYIVYMVATADPKKSKKERTFSSQTGKLTNSNKWD